MALLGQPRPACSSIVKLLGALHVALDGDEPLLPIVLLVVQTFVETSNTTMQNVAK